ncbi:3-dehydroquinate synthase family protein [Sphingomonas mesophila]|uniref:3-dehydroquinate synthase family protein n=1 Tax=Sphingomonas mesophila TaxID=2303576 RepID=UPI001F072A7F|nr:3-dehydroquinate synthase family protein [Sphingomonas mesophila]
MSRADPALVVGDLAAALDTIADHNSGRPMPLISDAHVHALHGQRLAPVADQPPILVPRGESAKSWATLAAIVDELALRAIPRGTPLLALGGGSVGDIAALAASLFKRGTPVIHIPTTLLAQTDSAVGGKTGLNSAGTKNIAGTFHPPALVVADPALLDTLDRRQLVAGYAEVVKYGLIDDPAFFAWCEAHGRALIDGDRSARTHAVRHCLAAKARLVRGDERDLGGTRTLLNLGHSFGHAIESAAGLGRLLHGEAVAVGLTLALRFSAFLRLCPPANADRLAVHLAAVGLPTRLDEVGLKGADLGRWMAHDKKNSASVRTLVLAHGIGRAFVARAVDEAALVAFLAAA